MERLERLELVGRVHVPEHDVLGQARLGPVHAVRAQHAAGSGGALDDPLLLGQQFQGGQLAPAGDNLVAVVRLPLAVQLRPYRTRLQQPVCLDRRGQGHDARPGAGAGAGAGALDVGRVGDQLGKADFGRGVGDSVGGHRSFPFFAGWAVGLQGTNGFPGTLLH